MLITILDTHTHKSLIVASPRFPDYWQDKEGAWDLERAKQFGLNPVKGLPNKQVAERYLIIKVSEGPTDFNLWNKNYSPDLVTRTLIGKADGDE